MDPLICNGSDSSRKQISSGYSPYGPLGENEIRLAEIRPASSGQDDLVCSLRVVQRNKSPAYNALSYWWGPRNERDKGRICFEVDTDRINWPVALTLESALRRLRYSDTPLLIWVDALCINQEDLEERGKHVQNMRFIYQNAIEVSVWLGPGDDKSILAWNWLREFQDYRRDSRNTEIIRPPLEEEFSALVSLFRRDYFSRIWVVQEIACARNAMLYCDPVKMPWRELISVINDMEESNGAVRHSLYHQSPSALFEFIGGGPRNLRLTVTWDHNSVFSESKAPPLFGLLRMDMNKGSEDPRDKVYALVGISSDRTSFGKIDYDRSPRAIYMYTARHIISKTQKLNLICLMQNDDNRFNLPSWVPDWERRNLYPSHRVVGLHIREPPFMASGTEHAKVTFAEDGEVLIAKGFVVDVITTVAKPFYLDGPESEVTPTLITFNNWWNCFVDNVGVKEQEISVFSRTFCGGSWAPTYSKFEEDLSQRLSHFGRLLQRIIPSLAKNGYPIPTTNYDTTVTDNELEKRERAMVSFAALRMHAKRFIVSRNKLAGLASMKAKAGDKIVILFGCDFPVVMRDMGNYWTLINDRCPQ